MDDLPNLKAQQASRIVGDELQTTLRRASILVADLPSGIATLRNVLGERATFIHADTIDAALKSSKSADMIVCGIHFDDSRMFDLLRLVKADSQSRSIPFLCYRDLGSELPATLF